MCVGEWPSASRESAPRLPRFPDNEGVSVPAKPSILEELVRRARRARISVIRHHVAHASTAVDMAAGVAAHAPFLAANGE